MGGSWQEGILPIPGLHRLILDYGNVRYCARPRYATRAKMVARLISHLSHFKLYVQCLPYELEPKRCHIDTCRLLDGDGLAGLAVGAIAQARTAPNDLFLGSSIPISRVAVIGGFRT